MQYRCAKLFDLLFREMWKYEGEGDGKGHKRNKDISE
jgi:hypothetical protein